MRYCHNCHRMTTGQPQFCNNCGRSFNVKLCPRLHVNPRAAQVCSQCGSHELSTPQPTLPMLMKPVVMLLGLGPGILLLLLLSIWLVVFVRQLLRDPNGLLPLMLVALVLGLLLNGWIKVHRWTNKRHK